MPQAAVVLCLRLAAHTHGADVAPYASDGEWGRGDGGDETEEAQQHKTNRTVPCNRQCVGTQPRDTTSSGTSQRVNGFVSRASYREG